MQGNISFSSPITNLPWKLKNFSYLAGNNSVVVNIDLFLSIEDRDAGRILCTREYVIPLDGHPELVQTGETLIAQILAQAVQSDGNFSLQLGD